MGKTTDVRASARTETACGLSDEHFLTAPPTTVSPHGKNQVHPA